MYCSRLEACSCLKPCTVNQIGSVLNELLLKIPCRFYGPRVYFEPMNYRGVLISVSLFRCRWHCFASHISTSRFINIAAVFLCPHHHHHHHRHSQCCCCCCVVRWDGMVLELLIHVRRPTRPQGTVAGRMKWHREIFSEARSFCRFRFETHLLSAVHTSQLATSRSSSASVFIVRRRSLLITAHIADYAVAVARCPSVCLGRVQCQKISNKYAIYRQ